MTVDEILHFLVADTMAPSSFGAQLDRMKFGLSPNINPFQARDDTESSIMRNAEILRVLREFSEVQEFRPASSRTVGFRALSKIQRGASGPIRQGQIALGILRSNQPWSGDRGLVEVFWFLRKIAPKACPTLDLTTLDAVQAFREGSAKRSKALASEALADAILALGSFLRSRKR